MAVYLLPGMGADSSMYGGAFGKLQGVRFIEWPSFRNEYSVTELSLRIIRENNIKTGDIVGGSSLGGITAAEIAKHVPLSGIILIGSTLHPDSINPILKKLSVLSEITPVRLVQAFAAKADCVYHIRLLKMFSMADTMFVKAMCRAVFEWQGNETPDCPVHHIHGEKDHVIFPPEKGGTIIENGGHLIAMTHEKTVVDFVRTEVLT